MSKAPYNLYVETDLKERFKQEVENPSEVVQEWMRQRLKSKGSIDNRLKEIQEEIEELEKEKENLTHKLENLRTEKRSLEAQKAKEEETPDEMERFKQVFQKQDWRSPEEIPDYWRRELEKPKEELWEEVAE
jgi:chromosome segregation ATPase